MLRITLLDSAAQARKYYIQRQSLEHYYTDNQEFNGYWGGKGAAKLGLTGYMKDEEFSRLLDNLHPKTGQKMTPRMQEDRRPGFDISFDCPKSVSLAYALTGDDRIIQAFRRAVWSIRDEMEVDAATRVRTGLNKNTDGNRRTGNWIAAEFIHLTARPEDGFPDPNIHAHLVVMNMTYDPEEKKWKALQMGDIKREAPSYQAAFHLLLKENLEAIGLKIVPTDDCFEIEGVMRETIEKFSRRTLKIEETAARLGITDPEMKAKLGVMTRERKNNNLTMSELKAFWQGCLTPEENVVFKGIGEGLKRSLTQELIEALPDRHIPGRLATGLGTQQRLPEKQATIESSTRLGTQHRVNGTIRKRSMNQRTTPRPERVKGHVVPTEHDREALALAIDHVFERESAVSEKKLLGEAFKNWRVGKATYAGIKQAFAEAPLLRVEFDGRMMVTTTEVLAEENRLIALCQQGKDKFKPINQTWKTSDQRLNAGQRESALLALGSRDFVTGISGVAGGGKTTVMHEIVRGIEAAGGKAFVLAPLAVTAHETLAKDGFSDTATIAHFLQNESMQRAAEGAVLLVDEARMIPNRLAERFLLTADRIGAKVIFVGDTGQHHGVERGQAFDLLRDSAGMQVAEVREILRQTGPYRKYVEMYIKGQPKEAVEFLRTFGALKEQPLEQLVQTFATDYARLVSKGKKVLAISPTHAEADLLTDAIRERLREGKMLGSSKARQVLRQMPWTDEAKAMAGSYQAGMVVQFNQRVNGFDLGQRAEVLDVREEVVRLRVTSADGKTAIVPLPLTKAEAFEVMERRDANAVEWPTLRSLQWTEAKKSDPEHYKIGQVIQFNRHVKGFALGEQLEVVGVRDDSVRVKSLTRNQPVRMLPLNEADRFSVYERRSIEITEGEKIRITSNGMTPEGHRLINGSHHKVDYIAADGRMVLENGWHIAPTFAHVDHGYVLTSYAAQGMTVDWVLACQTRALSSPATNYTQHHVATTRGRQGLFDYTDNVEWLKDRVDEKDERMMAHELLGYHQSPVDRELSALEREEFAPKLEVEYLADPFPIKSELGEVAAEEITPECPVELEKVYEEPEQPEIELSI